MINNDENIYIECENCNTFINLKEKCSEQFLTLLKRLPEGVKITSEISCTDCKKMIKIGEYTGLLKL